MHGLSVRLQVGDSRGVLGRETKKGWEAVDLTYDHKPTNTDEKARILRSNGRVERCVHSIASCFPFPVDAALVLGSAGCVQAHEI